MSSGGGGSKILVWDLPARVCHWGFALSLTSSLWIGFRNDPESEVFKWHMPVGSLAIWFLAIRAGLLFFGSPLSRWRSFFHSPQAIVQYFSYVIRWRAIEPSGLNPGTALFAPGIYLATIAIIVTGFVADWVETWHGRAAWAIAGLIAFHLAGLTLHALRHHAPTPLAMIHGRRVANVGENPARCRFAFGLVLLGASVVLLLLVCRYFDVATSTLDFPMFPELQFPLVQKG